MTSALNSDRWAGTSPLSVDIHDLLYINQSLEEEYLPALNEFWKWDFSGCDEVKEKYFTDPYAETQKYSGAQGLSGSNEEKKNSLWEKTISWVTENPGKTLFGAALAGVGIAYKLYRNKWNASPVRKKRRKYKSSTVLEIDLDNSKDRNEAS